MPYDWSKVSPLAVPVQTTANDVIFSGHGKLATTATTTVVPAGIELWLLCPPGGELSNAAGQALENMTALRKLGLLPAPTKAIPNPTVLSPMLPIRYAAGKTAPNYTLQPPNNLVLAPQGPHLLGVTTDTLLSDLWVRAQVFVRAGTTVRCFWAACTVLQEQGLDCPVVLYQ